MKTTTKLLTALALVSALTGAAQAQWPPPSGGGYGYRYQPQPPTMIPNPSPGLVYGAPYGGRPAPEMVPNYGAPGMPEVGGGLTGSPAYGPPDRQPAFGQYDNDGN